MWSNLKKTSNMEVGQIGFHKNKEVRWGARGRKLVYVSFVMKQNVLIKPFFHNNQLEKKDVTEL